MFLPETRQTGNGWRLISLSTFSLSPDFSRWQAEAMTSEIPASVGSSAGRRLARHRTKNPSAFILTTRAKRVAVSFKRPKRRLPSLRPSPSSFSNIHICLLSDCSHYYSSLINLRFADVLLIGCYIHILLTISGDHCNYYVTT